MRSLIVRTVSMPLGFALLSAATALSLAARLRYAPRYGHL